MMINQRETTAGETPAGEWVRVYVSDHPGYAGAFEVTLMRGQMIKVRCDYVAGDLVDDVKTRFLELGKTWCKSEPTTVVE